MAGPFDGLKGHEIHQEFRDCVDHLIKNDAKPFYTYKITDARKAFDNICLTAAGTFKFDGEVQEKKIPSPHCKDGVPVSVYIPNKLAAEPAILVYFHGGGLCMFERKYYEPSLQMVAQEAGCIVVNSDYRLLPESPPLSPFDDGVVVVKDVIANKVSYGGKPGSKVGVGGDSSGGQIAVSVTKDVPGLDFMVLIYVHADLKLCKPSIKEYESSPVLPHPDLQYFTKLVGDVLPNQATDPRVCPLARTDLKTMPPAIFIQAELDPLKDGGLEFAEKLKAAGVQVETHVCKGVPHIFFGMTAIYKTKCAEARGHMVKFIKKFQKN